MAELGVVAAAESGGELHDPRALGPEDDLRVRGPVGHAESLRRPAGRLDGLLDGVRARPGVRERDAEGRFARGEPVGDGQRVEAAADRERVHGHLGTGDELLDEGEPVARRLRRRARSPPRTRPCSPTTESPFWPWRSTGLTTPGSGSPSVGPGRQLPARLRDAVLVEQLALAMLQDGMSARRPGSSGCGSPACAAMPGGDRDRPVDPGRDDPVHLLGAGELADGRLVLDGDDRAAVGVLEADRGGVAVAGDDVEPPLPGGAVQPELRRPRA